MFRRDALTIIRRYPLTAPGSAPKETALARKPLDEEIDVYGLTHPGKVRKVNQDHFLLAALRKRMDVILTSLPEATQLKVEDDRLAFLAVVADGVGGSTRGEMA